MQLSAILWLATMVFFIVFEIATMGLYTIWFAGGSLAAFFLAVLGFNKWWQLGIFVIVSGILLFFTRPIVKKKFQGNIVKTNAEGLIGEQCRIVENVDNVAGTGRAVVAGQDWMARAACDSETFAKDDVAVIESISGVKLIIKKVEE